MLLRRVGLVVGVSWLCLALATPALAGQLIKYRGETSQGERIVVKVLKRDSGRRFLTWFHIEQVSKCEDMSTRQFGFVDARRPGPRLGPDGQFRLRRPSTRAGAIHDLEWSGQGHMRFGSGAGTFELSFEDDQGAGDGVTCSTGLIEWSVERRRSRSV